MPTEIGMQVVVVIYDQDGDGDSARPARAAGRCLPDGDGRTKKITDPMIACLKNPSRNMMNFNCFLLGRTCPQKVFGSRRLDKASFCNYKIQKILSFVIHCFDEPSNNWFHAYNNVNGDPFRQLRFSLLVMGTVLPSVQHKSDHVTRWMHFLRLADFFPFLPPVLFVTVAVLYTIKSILPFVLTRKRYMSMTTGISFKVT